MATLATQLAYEEPITLDIEEPIITSETTDPTHEQIATLAYAHWLEGGCSEGADEENWLRAEHELTVN